jgi:hydrogenase maturation protein HypF
MEGRRWLLGGRVQGVGFRPFVHRTARRHQLSGWVRNLAGQVEILAAGEPAALACFGTALLADAPPFAHPTLLSEEPATPPPGEGFAVLESQTAAAAGAVQIPPDQAVCDDCLAELRNPADRRHRYPFLSCTQCGPRHTVVERLPWDRANTSMARFPLCLACAAEYADPADRRFHAETTACPRCGPRITFAATGVNAGSTEGRSADRSPATEGSRPRKEGGASADGCIIQGSSASNGEAGRAVGDWPRKGRAQGRLRAAGNVQPPAIETGEAALRACVAALRSGRIVAVKGIGGYHLLCDAANEAAVARLRARKRRPHKPLAVMARDEDLGRLVACDPDSLALLRSPTRPIVLLARRAAAPIAANVAPDCGELGVILPYSPLHHLLLDNFAGPLVATSGNVSGEPVLTDNAEAEQRLGTIADHVLHHDRPIARPADDPVFRPIAGRLRPLRLGRGTAPLELALPRPLAVPMLAFGGQGKVTVALGWGRRAVVSPHLGDMETPRALALLRQTAEDLQALHGVRAEAVACDAHPGYATARFAATLGLPVRRVFHHRAHAAALAGEFGTALAARAGETHAGVTLADEPGCMPWLVFTWDGAGYGEDGTIWGGEALLGHPGMWRRVASLRPFALPGGERAAREPWRSALAVCWEAGIPWTPPGRDTALLRHAWERRLNCPQTSAAGRLFDAAAALLGLVEVASHEGHAAMRLEAATALAERSDEGTQALPLTRREDGVWLTDWAPLIQQMMEASRPVPVCAALFHHALAAVLRDQALVLRAEHGPFRVGLTGGVFQNRVLADRALSLLRQSGFDTHLPCLLPCNDAAISYGQLVEASA